MEKVIIYTDGACSGNPGPGGWGAILMYKGIKKEISGGNKQTTNNIMELTAVIEGLKMLKFPCEVDLYSASAYVVNAFEQKWIYGWVKKNWKTASGDSVKNKDTFEISASVGYASGRGKNLQDIIKQADENMYIDKKKYHESLNSR